MAFYFISIALRTVILSLFDGKMDHKALWALDLHCLLI